MGIESDTVVVQALMMADNALGAIVYGFDSTYALYASDLSSYRNPYLEELHLATLWGSLTRQCLNFVLITVHKSFSESTMSASLTRRPEESR